MLKSFYLSHFILITKYRKTLDVFQTAKGRCVENFINRKIITRNALSKNIDTSRNIENASTYIYMLSTKYVLTNIRLVLEKEYS